MVMHPQISPVVGVGFLSLSLLGFVNSVPSFRGSAEDRERVKGRPIPDT